MLNPVENPSVPQISTADPVYALYIILRVFFFLPASRSTQGGGKLNVSVRRYGSYCCSACGPQVLNVDVTSGFNSLCQFFRKETSLAHF